MGRTDGVALRINDDSCAAETHRIGLEIMSVIALSSCAAAPFAQRPTSAANRYVLIVYCCASLALMQARLLSLWQELLDPETL